MANCSSESLSQKNVEQHLGAMREGIRSVVGIRHKMAEIKNSIMHNPFPDDTHTFHGYLNGYKILKTANNGQRVCLDYRPRQAVLLESEEVWTMELAAYLHTDLGFSMSNASIEKVKRSRAITGFHLPWK
ncbi:hypothetical protein ACJ73_09040 [Blastomyces percursus]|uniref:Uncharacterized protein n=1 Tax=Blastomyces percursus TaxID=1658174 RepID=A0A1J9QF71_9EURO|nr:hypothetical protein ACJ73_09040 [Blastomyces percursus]